MTNSFQRNRRKCDVDTLPAFGIPNVRAKYAFGNTKRDFFVIKLICGGSDCASTFICRLESREQIMCHVTLWIPSRKARLSL
jgi:hypothetical protein